ncbi:RDD family protein [Serinibacter salmoneus]|uniref:Putative RDD family membrane protein YckC n=1 Tax=Serinibacter salmoneus TaxID=556530 RepID=A0A2A9D2D0_9MICO|nr:RDD family protein [Serinibacter salmoneus]PFG20531.1 putative RDD family membrane protein YckC [Serinibacter salmoneus]
MVLMDAVVPSSQVAAPPLAGWWRRAFAVILDDLLLAAVAWLAVGSAVGPTLHPPIGWSGLEAWAPDAVADLGNGWVVGSFLALLVLQAYTGATPGKRVTGVVIVDAETGRPVGLLRTLLRPFAHVLDALLFIGYLRPLWDAQHRTFADSLLRTRSVQTRSPVPHPWLRVRPRSLPTVRANAVTLAAWLVCGLGLAFAFPLMTTITHDPGPRVSAACEVTTSSGWDHPVPRVRVDLMAMEVTERRLWVTRTSDGMDLSAEWTWTSDAPWASQDGSGDLAGAEGSLWAVGVDGSARPLLERGGLAMLDEDGGTLVLDAGPEVLAQRDGREDLLLRLRENGRDVATCTLPASALTTL